MVVIHKTIRGTKHDGRLIQEIRRNKAGCLSRVSIHQVKAGKQIPVSETIYYSDGTSCLHMYNEAGDVWQVSMYDKDGQELFPIPADLPYAV